MWEDRILSVPSAKPVSNQHFGSLLTALLLLLAVWPVLHGGSPRAWALVAAALAAVVTVLAPSALSPLSLAWHRLGRALHQFVSPIVLGILFFVVICPFGWLL